MITEDQLRRALGEIAAEADTEPDTRPEDVIDVTASEIATLTRRRRTWWFPAAAAVAAVLITVVTLAGHDGDRPTTPASLRPYVPVHANPLAGTMWRLTEVRSAHVTWSNTRFYIAGVAFGADGRLFVRDIVDTFTASYHTSGDRITLRDVSTGGLGSSTPADAAMSRVFVPGASRADSITSTFRLTATRLTVRNGRWTLIFRPPSAPDRYCLEPPPAARAGTGARLVPRTPTAVTICPYGPARSSKTVTAITELVHSLDALPTSQVSNACDAHGPTADPAGGGYMYELYFHYQTGPDVLVNVISWCAGQPGIDNQRLQAAVEPRTILPLISAALGKR